MSSLIASKFADRRGASSISDEEVVRLEDVSVQYRVPQERIGTFKEYAIRWVQGKVKHRSFLALQNVDLSIRKGEVFGLIGQNGAGKSTLLKLVARVLRPTRGRVMVKGFVAPLLEIGAGFHPELTGRENIFLNGAMLGFTREEMEKKFQSIVDFAELGDFIDAPLRTYSSGMWARLGFAVATETQPEILIVDEILSVGDEAFQHRSLERIQSFKADGATILLVSHSMSMIEQMCQQAAWLSHGKVIASGSAHAVVDQYLGQVREEESKRLSEEESKRLSQESTEKPTHRWGDRRLEIRQVQIFNAQYHEQNTFYTGETLILTIDYFAHETIDSPTIGIAIYRQDGVHITGPNTSFADLDLGVVNGPGRVIYTIPYLTLLEGLYSFTVATVNREDTVIYDYHDRLYPFRVNNHGKNVPERYGLMTMRGEWKQV
jgi:ABC-type polysaccharide/polyol phosphate transport system ATPase subunit